MYLAKKQAKQDGRKRTHMTAEDINAMNSDSGSSIPALIKKAPTVRGQSDNARYHMYQQQSAKTRQARNQMAAYQDEPI